MILQQIMERMEKMMNRMENRLSNVDKLERRCERLEATCSSILEQLKDATILMRRGNLDYLGLGDEDGEIEAILLDPHLDEGVFEDTTILHPHWS